MVVVCCCCCCDVCVLLFECMLDGDGRIVVREGVGGIEEEAAVTAAEGDRARPTDEPDGTIILEDGE